MEPGIIVLLVIAALVVYLIASHKIDLAHVKAQLGGLEKQLGLVHSAAMAPVLVAPAPQASSAPDIAATVAAAIGAPAPAPLDPVSAEWQRRRAKYGDDLWAVQDGEKVSLTMADMPPAKAAGFTKTEDFAAKWAVGRPVEAASAHDFNQANVTPADAGKNFHVGPGAFTRTLTIPEGFTGGVKCFIDKINERADDAITISVDGVAVVPPGANFPAGPFVIIRGVGEHKISGVASDNTFVWQIQLVP